MTLNIDINDTIDSTTVVDVPFNATIEVSVTSFTDDSDLHFAVVNALRNNEKRLDLSNPRNLSTLLTELKAELRLSHYTVKSDLSQSGANGLYSGVYILDNNNLILRVSLRDLYVKTT